MRMERKLQKRRLRRYGLHRGCGSTLQTAQQEEFYSGTIRQGEDVKVGSKGARTTTAAGVCAGQKCTMRY